MAVGVGGVCTQLTLAGLRRRENSGGCWRWWRHMLGAVHVPVGGFKGSAVTQEVRHGGGSAFSRGWHKHWRM